MVARGEFEVNMKPLDGYAEGKGGAMLGRMSIDKMFRGDLDAVSKGEMLSARAAVPGSAGYVAMEQVDGVLAGKKGTFVLQHFGTMKGDDSRLLLEVSPDSGSGELQGLSGTMEIIIEAGKHRYEFSYELAETD